MFLLCSELSLGSGNSLHYLSPSAAAFSGNNEIGHDLCGCMRGRTIPIISGKGFRKKYWKTQCTKCHNSEGKCVVLDLACRVLCNQVMSMVRGEDLQFFTIVKLDPLVASLFIRGEGGSLSTWRSFIDDESLGEDFFTEHIFKITFSLPAFSWAYVAFTLVLPQPRHTEHLAHIRLPCKIKEWESVESELRNR